MRDSEIPGLRLIPGSRLSSCPNVTGSTYFEHTERTVVHTWYKRRRNAMDDDRRTIRAGLVCTGWALKATALCKVRLTGTPDGCQR